MHHHQSLIAPSAASSTAGRAIGLAVALFFAGSLFGGLLENWVRVDIVPIGVSGLHGAAALGALLLLVACSAVVHPFLLMFLFM